MKTSRNKRKSDRRSCLVPVLGKQGSPFEQTRTIDISQNGLGLISSRRISLKKEIAIQLDLAEKTDPVLVIGQVRWVRPIPNSSHYRIGMHFRDVLGGSRTDLGQYLSR